MNSERFLKLLKKQLNDETLKFEDFFKVPNKKQIQIQITSRKDLNSSSVILKYEVAQIYFKYNGEVIHSNNKELNLENLKINLNSFQNINIYSGFEGSLRVGYINKNNNVHIFNKRDFLSFNFKNDDSQIAKQFQNIAKKYIKNVTLSEIRNGDYIIKIQKDNLFIFMTLTEDSFYNLRSYIIYKDFKLDLEGEENHNLFNYLKELDSKSISDDLKLILLKSNIGSIKSANLTNEKNNTIFNICFNNTHYYYKFKLDSSINKVKCINSRSKKFIPQKEKEINHFLNFYCN